MQSEDFQKDFAEFEPYLDNDHTKDAAIILMAEVNGAPEDDGETGAVSIRFTYAETLEDMEACKFKQMKFWIMRESASETARLLHEEAVTRYAGALAGPVAARRRPRCSNHRAN